MLRNRVDELIKLFFTEFSDRQDDELIEDFIDFLINVSKDDEKISELMDINEDELCYLKIIAMEKIELLYYLVPNKDKELLKIINDEIDSSVNIIFQKISIKEIKELIYNYIDYLNGNINKKQNISHPKYNDRVNNEYLKHVYDIYEIMLEKRKEVFERNIITEEFEEIEEEFEENTYHDVMDYLDFNYIDKEQFFKKFIINSYAVSKINNIETESDDILTVENYIENEGKNLSIKEMLEDEEKIFMILEQSLESFLQNGYDLNAEYNVVNQQSMNAYLKLDPDVYKKNILSMKTRVFDGSTSYLIFDVINDSLYDFKDNSLYDIILSGDIYKYNRKYCLNEPLKKLMTDQIIKYLIGKFIEYCAFNYNDINVEIKEVYDILINEDLEKLDSKYLIDIFENYGQNITNIYLSFNNINLRTINKYRRNIYENKLMDKLLYISPSTTSEYFDIIDSRNVETIRIFRNMISIIREAEELNSTPYEYFNKVRDYIECTDEELIGSLVTILYENLLLDKNCDRKLLEYFENTTMEEVINNLLGNDNLFNFICKKCNDYYVGFDSIEKYLRNRKKKQIANKIKVISKLNPFYQEEKRTCY